MIDFNHNIILPKGKRGENQIERETERESEREREREKADRENEIAMEKEEKGNETNHTDSNRNNIIFFAR